MRLVQHSTDVTFKLNRISRDKGFISDFRFNTFWYVQNLDSHLKSISLCCYRLSFIAIYLCVKISANTGNSSSLFIKFVFVTFSLNMNVDSTSLSRIAFSLKISWANHLDWYFSLVNVIECNIQEFHKFKFNPTVTIWGIILIFQIV